MSEERFTYEQLEAMHDAAPEAKRVTQGGAMWVWKEPEPGRKYIVAVDPLMFLSIKSAVLESKDRFAIQVIDAETGEQCAEVADLIDLPQQAERAFAIAEFYNSALLAIEVNGAGAMVQSLVDMEYSYKNCYAQRSNFAGFMTTERNRKVMMTNLKSLIESNPALFRSTRLIKEWLAWFQVVHNQYDDLTMAMGIAQMVRLQPGGSK